MPTLRDCSLSRPMHVTYFVAASLDGFIAGPDGRLDWLLTDDDYGFASYFGRVDALVMGRGTYDPVEGFGAWPYGETPSYVFTHRPLETDRSVEVVSGSVEAFSDRMVSENVGELWVVGGGEVAAAFLAAGRLDAVVVSLHPVILGGGTPLFGTDAPVVPLRLDETRAFPSGLVQLRYTVERG